ncbi:MAG: hypothetical protein H0X29_06380 [Parachlamydiaceae bacterium]|nr:hypothetical protein [Parachlamydiaceae bacterium]
MSSIIKFFFDFFSGRACLYLARLFYIESKSTLIKIIKQAKYGIKMTAITEFVRNTAYEITTPQCRLPGCVWSALTSLNQVHSVWRWYRRAALYRNPDNFSQLLTGHAINFVFGESTILKIAAQSLLIATRLLECARRQASLYHEGARLIQAIKGHYPSPIDVPWIEHSSFFLFSPSSVHGWKVFSLSLWDRTSRSIYIITRIFLKTFTLSMCIMDTIDAFYISPTTKNEAITESCLNIILWLDTLVDKKEALLQGISENKEIIEIILKGSPFTYSQLEASISSALTTTEAIQQQAKKITSIGNGCLVEIGKRSLQGALIVAGIK